MTSSKKKPAFNYRGLSQRELRHLCDQSGSQRGLAKWRYWTSETYSFGSSLRDFARYPRFLPLHCYMDHGVSANYDSIPPHELESDAPLQLYQCPKSVKLFQQVSDKPCYCVISPFVWYRRKHNIRPVKKSVGTLAFPAHSTMSLDLVSKVEDYIASLKGLPAKFRPVCVCLHMMDIYKGAHRAYMDHGIPVYTAGCMTDQRFSERWYELVRHFSYTTSNAIGSYTFYSVEMGIPFFLAGEPPVYFNNSDTNLPPGLYRLEESSVAYKKMIPLFSRVVDTVPEFQKQFVETNLGVHDSESRLKIAALLYWAYLKRGRFFEDLGHALAVLGKRMWVRLFRFKDYLSNKGRSK